MLTFQEVLLRLQRYWSDQGALLWLPYSEKVGAGTMNPATFLRVLGPEPWNVAYIEPSYRPDDGRYAENPNRMQMHTQLQVILKPDPGDPQERYLKSLEAIGIRREEHDIRFVEDNWESPALGAWGLGWEVWLDGQEITQYTYFQQAGGINLEMPAVELTYGLERIVMYLQNVRSVWDMAWDEQSHLRRDSGRSGNRPLPLRVRIRQHRPHPGDVRPVRAGSPAQPQTRLGPVPALDYILRCSHAFNLLDSRGTVGVTERAVFFKRMRDLSRQVAEAYLAQRDRAGFPWEKRPGLTSTSASPGALMHLPLQDKIPPTVQTVPVQGRAAFLFELGVEELPAAHLSGALAQWRELVPAALDAAKLAHGAVHIWGTPRRLVVYVADMALRQADETLDVKGPPASAAFDADNKPTRAAQGFARSKGVDVADLQVRETEGGAYIFITQHVPGRPAAEVLADLLPDWIAKLRFPRVMRWNETGVAFSRPIRWLLALLGEHEVPCAYAGLQSGRVTRGPRPAGSPVVALGAATDYKSTLNSYGVIIDPDARAAEILRQAKAVAADVGGQIPDDPALLEEVTNLVEVPTALLGSFEKRYLTLPQDVLIAVMKKHQRYFPVFDARGRIMAHFVAVRNGGGEHLDLVRQGNEDVIRARYADAEFFYNQDCRRPLAEYRDDLAKLTFQADLGSMLQKSERLTKLAAWVGEHLRLPAEDMATLDRAAYLAKADLGTRMVVEMTSLQGIMGREYAKRSGELAAVAQAIFEHYLPRSAGDKLPESAAGIALALADRLDSLAGLFAVGLAPTGSADPYGLRRAAAGIVQILLERQLSFSTRAGLAEAARALPVEAAPSTIDAAVDFIAGRLQVMLREMGLAYDVVEAALATRGENPVLAREAAQQLTAWIARDDWGFVLDNYARCVRITREQPRFTLDPAVLCEPAEQALYAALATVEAAIGSESDVDAFLTAFAPLVPFIQRFFDDVLVMDKAPVLREARLALLQRIAGLAEGIVDLSKLEGF
jgi:glycyl-tRNA synthetase